MELPNSFFYLRKCLVIQYFFSISFWEALHFSSTQCTLKFMVFVFSLTLLIPPPPFFVHCDYLTSILYARNYIFISSVLRCFYLICNLISLSMLYFSPFFVSLDSTISLFIFLPFFVFIIALNLFNHVYILLRLFVVQHTYGKCALVFWVFFHSGVILQLLSLCSFLLSPQNACTVATVSFQFANTLVSQLWSFYTQLMLGQHGFELCKSIQTWIFFNSQYYSVQDHYTLCTWLNVWVWNCKSRGAVYTEDCLQVIPR